MELTKDDILHEIEEVKQEKMLFKKFFLKDMKLNNIKMVWRFIKLFLVKRWRTR